MRTPRAVLAACVLLVLTACGTSAADRASGAGNQAAASRAAGTADSATRFGETYRFRSGILVAVSEPTRFQPSDAAYPASKDAIAFEVWVRNETGRPYRLSRMAVTVTAGGTVTKQIIDPTQGYTGVVSSAKGLPPDCEKQVDLAFAVPEKPGRLKVKFQPHQTRPASVTYIGEPRHGDSR